MQPEVSIVIVSWNGRQHLETCLAGVAAQAGVATETIVVDNGSTDGTAGVLRATYPWVRVVELPENRGFAGGNNAGVREARGRYVALLNNDTSADPGWLRALLGGVDEASGFALATSRIVYMHDPDVIDSAGDGVLRWGGAFKRHHGAPASVAAASEEVFGVCGAACLMPKAVFDELDGFDEDFFASHEDVDLSYRARLRGYRCRYVAEAVVRHVGSATLGTVSHVSVFHGQRNLEWMYVKNTPGSLLARTLPGHVVYDVAAAVHFARIGMLRPYVRAKIAALAGLPRMLRKRAVIQRGRRVGAPAIAPLLDTRWLATKLREKRFDTQKRGRESFFEDTLARQAPETRVSSDPLTTTPEIAAILVNYNAGGELVRALRSIADEMAGRAWEAVVVDNASVDGSAASVDAFAPMVRLVQNAENAGFARGVNQGCAASTAPLVLIMNPDCRLVAGAVATLQGVIERYPDCAMVGPRILNPDGTVQGSARGDPDMLTGLFGRTTLLRRLVPFLPVARRNVVTEDAIRSGDASVVVDWVSGACMLARRSALTQVRGFDERFFLYWEDADLCRRLRARGHHVRYVPGATAIHRVGQSSRTAHEFAIRRFHESAYLYYTTHVAPSRLNPKRAIARALLGARCWLQLVMAGVR